SCGGRRICSVGDDVRWTSSPCPREPWGRSVLMAGPSLFMIAVLGLACPLLGLYGLLGRYRQGTVPAARALAVLLLAGCGVALADLNPRPFLAFAAALGLLLVLRFEKFGAPLTSLLALPRRFPQLLFAVLLVGGPVCVALTVPLLAEDTD